MIDENFFPKTIKQIVLGDDQKPKIIEVPCRVGRVDKCEFDE